ERHPGGDDDVLVSATTATPTVGGHPTARWRPRRSARRPRRTAGRTRYTLFKGAGFCTREGDAVRGSGAHGLHYRWPARRVPGRTVGRTQRDCPDRLGGARA